MRRVSVLVWPIVPDLMDHDAISVSIGMVAHVNYFWQRANNLYIYFHIFQAGEQALCVELEIHC